MLDRLNFGEKRCTRAEAWLEEAASCRPHARALEDVLVDAPEGDKQHVQNCRDCKEAVMDFLESRALFRNWNAAGVQGNPFFAKRILAAIAAREAEVEQSTRTWAVVPKLAARLAAIATLVLLIAGTWVYEGPARKQVNQPVVEPGSQLFEDNSTVPTDRDEVLVSLLERSE